MKTPAFLLLALLLGLAPLPSAVAENASPAGDLMAYVKRPEPKFQWRVEKKETVGPCDVWLLKLTSQVWQDIPWTHDVAVFLPKGAPTDKAVLLNEGGKASVDKAAYGSMIAARVKAPVIFVLGIPNQPLFEGKKEDDLIAETFVRYLETKDSSWPLLFPMVKSLVKAMDAIQEFGAQEWAGKKPEKFIVGGASKRGWTTWLTAASDPRVMAITPMVIDTLNFQKQIPHQFESFGGPSEQIAPYTKRGLVPLPDTAEARKLWGMVDPWIYRERYTMPKLVVLGNNDRYWSTDALNLYWDDIPGDKWISYTPNAGHDLTERGPDGKKGDPFRALNNVCGFIRHQITGQPMPKLTWKHDDADGKLRLSVTAEPAPKEARLWMARSDSKDFRASRWEAKPIPVEAGKPLVANIDRPEDGYVAFYADLGYEIEEIPQWLCTQLRMAGKEKTAVR